MFHFQLSKFDEEETHETRRVVVTSCLGISVGFQDGIGRDDLILQTWLVGIFGLGFLWVHVGGHKGKVLNDLLCVFCLTSA